MNDEETAVSEPKYQFTVVKGPQPGKMFVLMTDTVTLGRDPMADISLNDPEVSRQHARLTKTASGYVIEDLGSTNSTFLNGDQLEGGIALTLSSGDTVSIGSGISLIFEIINEVPEPEPTPDEFEQMFVEASPELPEELEVAFDEPDIAHSPELPEPTPIPTNNSQPAQPLVPASDGEKERKRRRNIIIAVTAVILLCCCCLLFVWSGYYYWGDPLMKYLGLY
ncbi:MAG: FHA domain-containing protein [Chloroflexi bacterium]|nr:FHA domain-containing protein [Chloroflexota bacterium]